MSDERPLRVRQAAEATAYATVVTGAGIVASVLVTAVRYGPTAVALEAAAWYMLIGSIGLLGVAAVALRPRPRKRVERKRREEGEKERKRASGESYFTAFVMRVPPARWVELEPGSRIRAGWKVGFASVALLLFALVLSYLAELAAT